MLLFSFIEVSYKQTLFTRKFIQFNFMTNGLTTTKCVKITPFKDDCYNGNRFFYIFFLPFIYLISTFISNKNFMINRV